MPRIRTLGVALAAYHPDVDFFAEQLASLRAQTFTEWTCAICFDSPMAEVRRHPLIAPHAADARIEWIENPRRLGVAKNFEKAVQRLVARGVDAIAFADQDDRWYPEKLATLVAALQRAPALALVHSDMDVLRDGTVAPTTTWTMDGRNVQNCKPHQLLVRAVVPGCAALMDAELARRYPVIPDGIFHDHWYALAAAAHGGIHAIPTPLLAYRRHGSNVSGLVARRRLGSYLAKVRRPRTLVRNARTCWSRTERLLEAARREGMPIAEPRLGLLDMLATGVRHIVDDRPLATSSLFAALGKLLAGGRAGAPRPR